MALLGFIRDKRTTLKKIARLGLSWAFLAMLALPAVVQAQDFTYTTNGDNTINITGYTGTGGVVNIPSTTNGLTVTGIGYRAFGSRSSLTSVTIPDTITTIGDVAFYACFGLTSVTIPHSVTAIGNIPFIFCTNLSAIMVDQSNTVYSSIDGVLFDRNQVTLIECQGGRVGEYAIPDSVTRIGDGAFNRINALTATTSPASGPMRSRTAPT